jgi:quercetin dioxygenase-like cupin family protein
MAETFNQFEARTKGEGFDSVLVRQWEKNTMIATHVHPFDASAVVVQGEMWLTVGDSTQHLLPGNTFELARGTPHAERYGAEGATYWVARRGV